MVDYTIPSVANLPTVRRRVGTDFAPLPELTPTVEVPTVNPVANTVGAVLDPTHLWAGSQAYQYGQDTSKVPDFNLPNTLGSILKGRNLVYDPTPMPTMTLPADTVVSQPKFRVDTSNQRYANYNDLGLPSPQQQWKNAASSVGSLIQSSLSNNTRGFRNSWGQMSTGEKFNTGLKAVGSILEAINARKAHKLAKQTLAHDMMNNNRNYEMQAKAWNNTLEERQRYRNAYWEANNQGTGIARPESIGEYLNRYGAK